MSDLELLRRVQNLEREIKQMRAHSHGQYEIGIKSLQVVEAATGYQGLAILTTAHVDVVQGNLVCWLQGASGANNQVDLVPTSGNSVDMPIGVVAAGAKAGEPCWVIVAGYALVLPMTTVDPARGYVVTASASQAGKADQAASGSTAEHWREIGHWCADGTTGTLNLATLHFN